LSSLEEMEAKLKHCRQGAHCDPTFWCGFCVRHIDVVPVDGVGNSWTRRFDHIDNHFCGREGMDQKSIDEWKHPEPGMGRAGVNTSDNEGGRPFDNGQDYSLDQNGFRKRKAESLNLESQEFGKKRQHFGQRVVEMWDCVSLFL
jgi:hypothetical protein